MEFDLALSFIFIRIILPLVLGTVVVFRQNLFSCIYLVLLLVGPILPKPSAKSVLSGSVGVYIKFVIIISILINVAHLVFQIVLFSAFENYDQSIDYCDLIGRIYNLIGLHRYDGISVWSVLRLCGLDFLVLITSGALHVFTKRAYERQNEAERVREELAKEQETKRLERMERRERRMTEAGLSTVSVIANNKAIQENLKKKMIKQKASQWAYYITEAIFLILLCSAAILNPSVTSSLYFIYFLFILTWLSCNRSLGIQYHYFRIFIAIYVALHYILLFIYQMEFVRPYLPPDDIKARVFGLADYVNINCTTVRELDYQNFHWAKYVHPFVLIGLYFISATLIRTILIKRKSSLLSDDRTGKHYNTSDRTKLSGNSKGGLEMDANGSIIWKPENEISNYSSVSGAIGPSASRPESPVTPGGHMAAENTSHFVSPFVQFIKLIKRGSYVGTLIVMMTWSITYHSWLSFILLLSSCVIWMMPNSRQVCLKSSPALVAFALFLLVGQYVYSLDLTNSELPEMAGTVSMSEIGFRKYEELSYQPLFIKILYTLMFWITLRQFLEDRERESRKQFAQGVMVQPFNIGFGTGQPGVPRHDLRRQMSLATTTGTHQSPVVQWIFDILKELLIKYWIWVVATMLMIMSLSGNRVVLYRVVYMFLFLTFILLFQLSFALWRRFMYAFWLIVIVYSMIILTAIYTYQFNRFPDYWNDYLKINKELQDDLGLVVYDHDAWILFKELFTPTFFLIITIIQVHFLHKDFLEFSDFEKHSSTTSPTSTTARSLAAEAQTDANEVKLEIEVQSESSNDPSTPNTIKSMTKPSSPNTIRSDHKTDSSPEFTTPNQGSPVKQDKSSILAKEEHSRPESKNEQKVEYKSSVDEMKEIIKDLWHNLEPIIDMLLEVIWRLLEIHLIKAILFCAVFVAIADISAMNTIFVILIVLVMPFTQFEGIISHLLGLWAGILILLKMLFQLHVAQDMAWHTNCTDMNGHNSSDVFPFNTTIDNREYIGFKKTSNIFGYITEYIVLILVLVFRTVVIIHQNVGRLKRNERPPPPGVVFPHVGRKDADRDLKGLTMFLINYGFYKFGVEICFILLTISIGSRHDVFSVFYSIWLLFLVLMNRQTVEKVWPYFVGFLGLVLPLQYLLCLGIPPGLCFDYMWNSDSMNEELRDWLFLPDFRDPLDVGKLYLDFLILLFSCRQLINFRLEKDDSCIGGSNIEAHLEPTITHTNNVPDFFAFGHTVLDSIKSLFFFCFFWITLAVVFLAGTTRVSLFALGYVLGCFIFLWNGNEFYLKPVDLVFRLWKTIIAYTSGVILIKAILQIVGCVYITSLYSNFCWVVQLLGIACLGKYQINSTPSGTCIAPYDEAGLLWDGICFAFLIIQKRIFCSYYFCHLVREVKAQQVLASRGAELIHEIQAKEVADQEQAEKEVMEKIKQKMDRIKAAQQKMYTDKAKSIKSHKQAVRSGGYYMFDEADSEIVDLNEKPRQSLIPDPEGDEMRNIAKLHGFTAFCAKLMKGEVDTTSEKEATIVSAEMTTDIGESSKDSAIVSFDRERLDPDASAPTTITTLPSTSVSHISSRPSSLPIAMKDGEKPPDRGSGDELEEEDEYREGPDTRKVSLLSRMKNWFYIVVLFIESALISVTAKLNTLSRDYRYVARRLSVEKRYLKKLFEIEESNGSRYDFMDTNWKKRTLAMISQSTVPKLSKSLDSIEESHRKKRSGNESKKSVISEDALISIHTELEDSSFLKANIYMRFVRSIFYAILSRSEVMCYIIIVLNQISSASVLSLPLPLFAFLWGSLSVPRPSKAFWITVITYTEVIVVIKYIFQFQFWPWLASGKVDITPFYLPRILGIEKSDNYAQFDLALLLVLFFHRFMLKSLGLWDLSETEITAFMENAEKRKSISLDQTSSAEVNGRLKSDKKPKKLPEVDANVMHPYEPLNDERKVERIVIDENGVSDVDGFSEMTGSEDIIRDEVSEGFNAIYTIMIAPSAIKLNAIRFSKPFRHFFHSVLHPPYRITRDVYSLMFLCDFINFFILVFGFYAFGSGYSGSENVTGFLEENKIPIPFLVTLLLQFALIIIDRAIYLRKYIKGKLVFQIVLAIGIHMWLFFALPAMTGNRFTQKENWPPKMYFIFKCIYFLLSAYQIRSGYPTRILGNTFCKKYNLINWYLFKGYMLIPFLYDLRMYMDWIWTDTSLVLDEWSLMEDIFVNLYERKCELKLDEEFPEPRGKAKRRFFKYLLGGAWVIIIIGLIWGPLGLFALGRAVGSTNRPVGATFELELGGYQPLFRMSVTGNSLEKISDPLWKRLKDEDFVKDAVAQTFISGYDQDDVTILNLNGNSTAIWGISPPSQKSLESELRNNVSKINVKLTYYITRKKQQKTQDMEVTISNEQNTELDPIKDRDLRLHLARMLSDEEEENEAAIIQYIFPNYLRVPEKGKPSVVKQLKKSKESQVTNDTYNYRSVGVLLKKGSYENSSMTSWWEVHDQCDPKYMEHLDSFFTDLLKQNQCKYLPVVLFNDKVFIGLLAFLSGYGIIGIYTTFVFLVSRWVRGLNSESSFKVIYTRMPNVDRVLQLCLDIYLVRESREFELEEDLYAKLIFLYRSPETLIKWTKPIEELSSRASEQQRHPHSGRGDH